MRKFHNYTGFQIQQLWKTVFHELFFKYLPVGSHSKYGSNKFLSLLNIIYHFDSYFTTCEEIYFPPPQTHQYNAETFGITRIKRFCQFLKIRRAIKIGDHPDFPWISKAGKYLLYSFHIHMLVIKILKINKCVTLISKNVEFWHNTTFIRTLHKPFHQVQRSTSFLHS